MNELTEIPDMTKNYLEEGEIKKLVYPPNSRFVDYRPKDFIAYLVNGEWQITFTYLEKAGYELHLKRGGVRKFSNLNTVENCLRKIGVTEFKVIL